MPEVVPPAGDPGALLCRFPSFLESPDALFRLRVVSGSALTVLLRGENVVLGAAEGEPARPGGKCGEARSFDGTFRPLPARVFDFPTVTRRASKST
jgi:hypothetical protein